MVDVAVTKIVWMYAWFKTHKEQQKVIRKLKNTDCAKSDVFHNFDIYFTRKPNRYDPEGLSFQATIVIDPKENVANEKILETILNIFDRTQVTEGYADLFEQKLATKNIAARKCDNCGAVTSEDDLEKIELNDGEGTEELCVDCAKNWRNE